jgi:hypothetical protein
MKLLEALFGRPKPTQPTKAAQQKPEEATKVCRTCKRVLPLSKYSRNSGNPDGLQCSCKKCKSTYMKSYWRRKKLERSPKVVAVQPYDPGLTLSIHKVPQAARDWLNEYAQSKRMSKNDLYLQMINEFMILHKK